MSSSKTSLPTGWVSTRLGDLYSFEYGKSLIKGSRASAGEYPVYGSSGIVGMHDQYLVEGPAIIVGRKGAAGSVNYSTDNLWPIDTTYYVRDDKNLSLKFSYYLLRSLNLAKLEASTAIPGLNRNHAYDEIVWIPPTNEQHRIVAKIEELFSELDKGIENLKTARAQLKVYRQALLKHAFEGKLTPDPMDEAWPVEMLGDVLDFLTSGSRGWAQYYAAAGDLFIRAQNIKYDRLDLGDIAFVSLPVRAEGLRTRVRKGDLLITITGANVTKSALVEHDHGTAYVSQHVALCRPTNEIYPRFLYWFIVAEAAGRKQLNKMAYGAGKPGLNLENIRSVHIPLPKLSEQEKIVELIEDKLSIVDQLDQTLATSLQQAESLRQSILKKAFSGQLVPQDPHDEPASKLLARIQAERDAQSAKPKLPKATRSSV